MSDIERQAGRPRRALRILSWLVAMGAAFDIWELFRLAAAIRSAWGRP